MYKNEPSGIVLSDNSINRYRYWYFYKLYKNEPNGMFHSTVTVPLLADPQSIIQPVVIKL